MIDNNYERNKKYNKTIEYREKVMEVLLSNPRLASLCKNREVDEEEVYDLSFTNYVPKLFVDGTVTKTEAYILFDFDIERNYVDTYDNVVMYMQVYCHKDIIRSDDNKMVRIDAIVAELNEMFDGKDVLGIGLNDKVSEKILEIKDNKYVATQVIYEVIDFNEKARIRAKKHLTSM